MTAPSEADFKRLYASLEKHLRLKGLRPKTIEAYARGIRRIGARFDHRIDDLSGEQLTDYFCELLETHSWSSVKLDLYGLKFFYAHVLRKPWVALDLVKPRGARGCPISSRSMRLGGWCSPRACSAIGCCSSPSTAWACAWARGCA